MAGETGQEALLGAWRCVETSGLNAYLKALKVNFLKRKVACAFKPKVRWELTDRAVLRSTAPSPLGERVEEHPVGEEILEKDPNGKRWARTSVWQGSRLVTTARDPTGKAKDIVTERWVREDGRLIQLCTQGAVSFERVFQRKTTKPPPPPPAPPGWQAPLLLRVGFPELTVRQWRAVALNMCLELIGAYGAIIGLFSLASAQPSLSLPEDGLSYVASLTGLAGVLWGLMADAYGRRAFFRYGLPLAALTELLNGGAFSTWSLVALSLLKAMCPRPPGTEYLVEELGPTGRGAVAALVGLGAGLGAAVGIGLWTLVGSYSWGWRVLSVLKSMPLFYLSARVWSSRDDLIPESLCFAPESKGGLARLGRPIRSLLMDGESRYTLLVWALYSVLVQLVHSRLQQYLFVHLTDDCSYSGSNTSLLALIGGLVGLPVMLAAGVMSDKIGRVPVAQVCWLVGGLSYSLLYSAPCGSPQLMAGLVLVVAVAQFSRICVTTAVANELWRTEHRCLAGALVGMLSTMATSAGLLFFTKLEAMTGHREAEVILGLMVSVLLPVAWCFVPETAGRKMNSLRHQPGQEEIALEPIVPPEGQQLNKPPSYGSLDHGPIPDTSPAKPEPTE